MAAIFAFKCACCGKLHEGSPSFGYGEPWHYSGLSGEQRNSIATLDADLCQIRYPDQTDRFIRATLEIPILGADDPFVWGVWVSLSDRSFARYVQTFDEPVSGERFFGWLCNRLPFYPDTIALPAEIVMRSGERRPFLRLHISDPEEHPLVRDQLNGISVARAQEIAERAMHGA